MTLDGVANGPGGPLNVTNIMVSLVSGSLVVDGSMSPEHLDMLNFGEEAEFQLSYTASDGTEEADATVTVTFRESVDTLAELDESLPQSVKYQIVSGYQNGTSDAYTIKTSMSGDIRFDGEDGLGKIFTAAYCLDAFEPA